MQNLDTINKSISQTKNIIKFKGELQNINKETIVSLANKLAAAFKNIFSGRSKVNPTSNFIESKGKVQSTNLQSKS